MEIPLLVGLTLFLLLTGAFLFSVGLLVYMLFSITRDALRQNRHVVTTHVPDGFDIQDDYPPRPVEPANVELL